MTIPFAKRCSYEAKRWTTICKRGIRTALPHNEFAWRNQTKNSQFQIWEHNFITIRHSKTSLSHMLSEFASIQFDAEWQWEIKKHMKLNLWGRFRINYAAPTGFTFTAWRHHKSWLKNHETWPRRKQNIKIKCNMTSDIQGRISSISSQAWQGESS